ncbi:MAG: N-acetylneuraminate synthase family protein [Deltaproteobacteria bacterium]|nr:N-acetylneuraminate synthase family protein [Deltaproteobacteria bacterium]
MAGESRADGARGPTIRIGDRTIGAGHPCYVIAEIGVNHNGDLELAEQLIAACAEAGADAVKFQAFNVSELILPEVGKAPYQQRTSDGAESQTAMLERLAVDESFHRRTMDLCRAHDVGYLCTPYDLPSLDFLLAEDVAGLKIASTDTNNLWFLEQVAAGGRPVILSTGMTPLGEIQDAVRCLLDNGCAELAVLKCTSAYPTAPVDVHLRAMETLARIFPLPVGFSDHTQGVGASPYAVALGATIVEKHVTLDRAMPGPDHQASITPAELGVLVTEVRKVEQMLGSTLVGPTAGEAQTRRALQRCLVTTTALAAGATLSREGVGAKRTGGKGISAARWPEVVGRRLAQALPADVPIPWSAIEDES